MCDLLPSVSSATCPGGAASPLFVLVGSAAALHSFEGLKAQSRSVRRARASSEETEMLVGKKKPTKKINIKIPNKGSLLRSQQETGSGTERLLAGLGGES